MPSPNEITIPQLSRLIGTHEAPVLIDVCIDDDFNADSAIDSNELSPPVFLNRETGAQLG